jgi:Zn ribbon nucleic-acid-binding protein
MHDTRFKNKNKKNIVRPKCPNCTQMTSQMWSTSQKFFLKCPNCTHF